MRTLLTTLLVLTCLAGNLAVAHSKNEAGKEQTSFCEGRWPDTLKPSPLPNPVIAAVMNTKQGKEARAFKDEKGKPLSPETLMLGTRVQLANSPDSFFIVMGLSPMSGGDHSWFWIVRQSERKATVILFAGGNCLDIARTRTSGYNDVLSNWWSPTTSITNIYKYNGIRYKLWRTRSKSKL